jgi:hypothetical protein
MHIAAANEKTFPNLLSPNSTNIVNIGRGGTDMHKAIAPLFKALKASLDSGNEALKTLRIYFIGTSYAPNGRGIPTISPLAKLFGIEEQVMEITDRISYYHTLATLLKADALFIPGSDDPKYTASKIYPYLLTQKPIMAIFNQASSVISIMKEYGVEHVYDYETVKDVYIHSFINALINGRLETTLYRPETVEKYSAKEMTLRQCKLFDKVLSGQN